MKPQTGYETASFMNIKRAFLVEEWGALLTNENMESTVRIKNAEIMS